MDSPPPLIICDQSDPHVLHVTLSRPAQRNALSNALIIELADTLTAAAGNDDIRCVVLSGQDTFFSAGADIKEMAQSGFAAINNASRNAAWHSIECFPKPLIAAVEGIAFGGGHELVMLADIVIASEGARFAQPEINIGILPGDGATQRLVRVAGKSLTMLMVLTGAPIDAATALQAGLIAEVTPNGAAQSRALEIANVIALKAPVAARLAKRAVLAAYETTLSAGLAAERQAIREAFDTHDQGEGMAAFIEKRPARFTGR